MNFRKILIVAVILLVSTGLLCACGATKITKPDSLSRIEICRTLKMGIKIDEFNELFGEPINVIRPDGGEGTYTYEYDSHNEKLGPIIVKSNGKELIEDYGEGKKTTIRSGLTFVETLQCSKYEEPLFDWSKGKPLLGEYDFSKGDIAIVGTIYDDMGDNGKEHIGDFYIDDIELLQKVQKEWVTDLRFGNSTRFCCGGYYKIYIIKNKTILETFIANMHCNYINTKLGQQYFDYEQILSLRGKVNSAVLKRIKFPNLKEGRDYVKYLNENPNVIAYLPIDWLEFAGEFEFQAECEEVEINQQEHNADACLNRVRSEIQQAHPDEKFSMEISEISTKSIEIKVQGSIRLLRDLETYNATNWRRYEPVIRVLFAGGIKLLSNAEADLKLENTGTCDFKKIDTDNAKDDLAYSEEILIQTIFKLHKYYSNNKNSSTEEITSSLYEMYLEKFKQSDRYYLVAFNYAELLYQMKKYEKAAEWYDKVENADTKGVKYGDSRYAFFLCKEKIIHAEIKEWISTVIDRSRVSDNTSLLNTTYEGKSNKPQPRKMSAKVTEFFELYKLYKQYGTEFRRSKYRIDMDYKVARLYYAHNRFDEAVKRFKVIVEKYPRHRLAVFSAKLLFDYLMIFDKWDEIYKTATAYLENNKSYRTQNYLKAMQEAALIKMGNKAKKSSEEAVPPVN